MLRSARVNRVPALDAAHEVHAALHPSLRVHAVYARNLVTDDALHLRAFSRPHAADRCAATFVLEGAARMGWHEAPLDSAVWLEAGRGATLPHKRGLSVRCEALPTYRALVAEWAPALGDVAPDAPITQWTLDPTGAALAERTWAALRDPPPPSGSLPGLVAGWIGALRAAGVAVHPLAPDTVDETVPARLAELSAALDAHLSLLDAQPMVTDLEAALGVSSRQVSRLVRTLNARYGLNADGWIDLRNRRRTMLAAALLWSPSARVSEVARIVGYASAQAMARAFADAGLPAPRDVSALVASLGR